MAFFFLFHSHSPQRSFPAFLFCFSSAHHSYPPASFFLLSSVFISIPSVPSFLLSSVFTLFPSDPSPQRPPAILTSASASDPSSVLPAISLPSFCHFLAILLLYIPYLFAISFLYFSAIFLRFLFAISCDFVLPFLLFLFAIFCYFLCHLCAIYPFISAISLLFIHHLSCHLFTIYQCRSRWRGTAN